MGIFEGILLCTDLDGTLLKNDESISDENLEAIDHFKREGGAFTFVTGRPHFIAHDICERIKPNVPFGCANGGGVYDHINQKYIWTQTLPYDAVELIRCIDEQVCTAGIQINTFERAYFSKDNETMRHFRRVTGLQNIVRHYADIDEPLCKVVFGSEEDSDIAEIERILRSHPRADEFDFIRSERTLFEILPKGIGKGVALKKLSEYLGIDINRTVAVGDYNNDISMFEAAGVGIAVANACQDALDAADYVTVSNEEHALARVIYDIEQGKYL